MTRGRLAAAVVAGVAAWQWQRLLAARPPGGRDRWQRVNYRGRTVDVVAGPAATAAVVTGIAATGMTPVAPAFAAIGAGGFGLYDDLAGSTHARGLRGHFGALRSGVVTTGIVKLAGLAATGVAAHVAAHRRAGSLVTDVVLVAGTANLVNLLDLRPGRALKVVMLTSAVLAASADDGARTAAATAGAAAALLPADLMEQHMLGDCGANALGATLGWSLSHRGPITRWVASSVVVALTLLSETTSFSHAIERHPVLSAVDRWGRLPT